MRRSHLVIVFETICLLIHIAAHRENMMDCEGASPSSATEANVFLAKCPSAFARLYSDAALLNIRDGNDDFAKRIMQTQERFELSARGELESIASKLIQQTERSSPKNGIVLTRIRTGMGGWADRVKAITSGFLIALFLNKTHFVDWEGASELKEYFEGRYADWNPPEWLARSTNFVEIHLTDAPVSIVSDLKRGRIPNPHLTSFLKSLWTMPLSQIFAAENIALTGMNWDVVPFLKQNRFHGPILRALERHTRQTIHQWLWGTVLQPTNFFESHINAFREKMPRYLIGIHIRIGGDGGWRDGKTTINLTALNYFWDCANALLAERPTAGVFIAADSNQVLKIAKMKIRGEVYHGERGEIEHMDRGGQSAEGFRRTVLDSWMLGMCDIAILSPSGFSFTAAQRRNTPVIIFPEECFSKNLPPLSPISNRNLWDVSFGYNFGPDLSQHLSALSS